MTYYCTCMVAHVIYGRSYIISVGPMVLIILVFIILLYSNNGCRSVYIYNISTPEIQPIFNSDLIIFYFRS